MAESVPKLNLRETHSFIEPKYPGKSQTILKLKKWSN